VDDRGLVDAVLDGDHDAFRLLVEREQVAVYRACLRILGRPHDAEDVAQESFVMAYRSIGTYRGDGPLGGWLMRIATRQAFRRLGQRRPTAELPADLPLGAPGSDPVAAMLAGERQREVGVGDDAGRRRHHVGDGVDRGHGGHDHPEADVVGERLGLEVGGRAR